MLLSTITSTLCKNWCTKVQSYIDLKFDPHFGRVASVGNGFPQVSQLLTTDDGEHFLVPGKFVCINGNLLENRGPATHGFIS